MDLFNIMEHTRNTKIYVNGNTYDVDHDCVVHNVAEEDAKKLLSFASRVWRVWEGVSPKKAAEIRKQAAEAREQAKAKPEPKPAEPKADEEEYPAPTLQMPKAELQRIAVAYQVEFTDRTSKAELVRLIEEVMFEPVDE